MGLDGPPFLRELLEGLLRRPRVDVLPGDQAGRDLGDPPLGVDLAVEVAGVLLAVEVAVAGSLFAVGALLDVGQVASPSCRLSVVAAVRDVVAEGASVALVAHEWTGEPENREPRKHSQVRWVDVNVIPDAFVDTTASALRQYLNDGSAVSLNGW
ncbi:hypothetical protein [Streptomyces sp. NPDC088762]|uniref:hypothetical protein n=1 Tax=Streptomyces sp. NPDC088762 TaxID=3365891 RepID=UPI0038001756